MPKRRLLIIESSAPVREMLTVALSPRYDVDTAEYPAQASQEFRRPNHAAFVVEITLANSRSAGLDLIRELRAQGDQRPIIATAADPDDALQIQCYALGADVFLPKPYSHRVLAAIIARMFARQIDTAAAPHRLDGILMPRGPFTFAGVSLSPRSMSARFPNGRTAHLTPKELGLLDYFSRHSGRVVKRAELVAHAWGPNTPLASNALNTYLTRLRRLFDRHGLRLSKFLITKPKVGWLIQPQPPP